MAIERLPIGSWLRKGEEYLASRGVDETSANVEFMMGEVMRMSRTKVRAEERLLLSVRQGSHFWELVKERGRRVPLAYVLRSQPFCGLEIKVSRSVLVPRPETEELVARALDLARSRFPEGAPLHIVDIGTGTGCIALALARALPDAFLYATEISPGALKVAQENIGRCHMESRVRLVKEDLFKGGGAPAWADMVVTNPPYIPTAELERLEPEVREEPAIALDGGQDGLDAIRAVVADAAKMLKPGGWLVIEFGEGQGERVTGVFRKNGFEDIELSRDSGGLERTAAGRCPVRGK